MSIGYLSPTLLITCTSTVQLHLKTVNTIHIHIPTMVDRTHTKGGHNHRICTSTYMRTVHLFQILSLTLQTYTSHYTHVHRQWLLVVHMCGSNVKRTPKFTHQYLNYNYFKFETRWSVPPEEPLSFDTRTRTGGGDEEHNSKSIGSPIISTKEHTKLACMHIHTHTINTYS